jgi:hypothetical protein
MPIPGRKEPEVTLLNLDQDKKERLDRALLDRPGMKT